MYHLFKTLTKYVQTNLFDHNRGSSNDAVIPSSTVISLKGGHLKQSNETIITDTRIKLDIPGKKKYLIGTGASPHALLPPLPLKDHILLPTTCYALQIVDVGCQSI